MKALALLAAGIVWTVSVPAFADSSPLDTSDLLSIGSVAPPVEVSHWFGEQEPSSVSLASGEVHVVEFWATWCGPCVASIPHINELQQQYADRDVTFISISDEEPEVVEAFLATTQRRWDKQDQEPPTYAELTSVYRLATDPDRSVYEGYMDAAAQSGIPTAFLVGKDGHIEWIGHPMNLDEPLEQVVEGTWDREAAAEQFRKRQEINLIVNRFFAALRAKDRDQIDSLLATLEDLDETLAENIRTHADQKLALERFYELAENDPEAAIEAAGEALSPTLPGSIVNQRAWRLYEMAEKGRVESHALLQTAADATEAALTDDSSQGSLLDTIAHLYHKMGDLDRAIEFQRRAVLDPQHERDADLKAEIEAFLDQLLQEKAAQAPPEPTPT